MKISKKTLDALKTFANINANFLFKAGKKQATVAIANNIFGDVVLDEDIPQDFGIYNLNEFLGAVSLFNEPQFEFSGTTVVLSDAKKPGSSLKYVAADVEILHVPTKEIKVSKYELEFDLDQDTLSSIQKSSQIIGAPDVTVSSKGGSLTVTVCNKKNKNANDFSIKLPCTGADGVFSLKVENLKLMPGNHKVSVSLDKSFSRFTNTEANSNTFVAHEQV
jgi:hypothetical protein